MKPYQYLKDRKMSDTPRVEALISKVIARFPGNGDESDRRYYPAVHQELAPLARALETETITMQARIQELETWQRTICELLAPDGDEVGPEDAHDVVSCLRENLTTVEDRSALSENDINRWQEAIAPRHAAPQPWMLGNGGSWDRMEVQPISDEMLAELAQRYRSIGTPWNCRSMPLSPADREYMYLLYFSMQGLVARVRKAEASLPEDVPESTLEKGVQDWKGMSGAVAWQIIERHADNWTDIGRMMDEWLSANSKSSPHAENFPIGEMRDGGVQWFGRNPHAFPIGTQFFASLTAAISLESK